MHFLPRDDTKKSANISARYSYIDGVSLSLSLSLFFFLSLSLERDLCLRTMPSKTAKPLVELATPLFVCSVSVVL